MMEIREGGLDDGRVAALLKLHFDTNVSVTPEGSVHAFELDRLRAPDIHFWSAWDGETLLGVGALKALTPEHGEVKSMHVSAAARRRGVGAAILLHITQAARALGLSRLSLETGSFEFFEPARALYGRHGFVECAPFGEYEPDPNSTFMTREI